MDDSDFQARMQVQKEAYIAPYGKTCPRDGFCYHDIGCAFLAGTEAAITEMSTNVYKAEAGQPVSCRVCGELNERLALAEKALTKLTDYCPAVSEHGTEDDCRVHGCKEGRDTLAALKRPAGGGV